MTQVADEVVPLPFYVRPVGYRVRVVEIEGISAIDLFCGVGGLSQGLRAAGVDIAAGIDNDLTCAYPFTANHKTSFVHSDVRDITSSHLDSFWSRDKYTLLAGCAPCQPFSTLRNGRGGEKDNRWPLLDEFSRLIKSSNPTFVTMENVPRIINTSVFQEFVESLRALDYFVDYEVCYCPDYGLPQHRKRLVLVASSLGKIHVGEGSYANRRRRTVRQAIGNMPKLAAGQTDSADPLHRAQKLSAMNLRRIQESTQGGTWRDWPAELQLSCHTRDSGASFASVYGRMSWDEPSPTITTQSFNYGTGRFGHPEQDRAISLREAAILQGFPKRYKFVDPASKMAIHSIGRLIGNAVPPLLGKHIGDVFMKHAASFLNG